VTARLVLDRAQILAFRRRVGALDERLAPEPASLRRAAWAGLQDSMPRAALISLHARVAGTRPDAWEDPGLVQLWGPRFSAFAVAADDRAVFTLGRLPDDPAGLARAVGTADRLEAFLAGRRLPFGEAGRGMGVPPNALRYAAPTGRVLIRWDGARQPTVWTVPAPATDPRDARIELLRRYLHVFGPGTLEGFLDWAGIRPARGRGTFEALMPSLVAVRTPIGDGWILADDEPAFQAPPTPAGPARLLPSGDAFYLLQGRARELLVPDAARRAQLWTSRVWPGALLVAGEVAGTWRRADEKVTVEPWRALTAGERAAVESEALQLPLPGLARPISVTFAA
jgi:hypothetical protein